MRPKALASQPVAALLASLSSLIWGVADFAGGTTTRRASVFSVVMWSQMIGLVIALVAAPFFGGSFESGSIGWSALAGIGGATGLLALCRGLSIGRAAIVAPRSRFSQRCCLAEADPSTEPNGPGRSCLAFSLPAPVTWWPTCCSLLLLIGHS